jgi:hypothetical protein
MAKKITKVVEEEKPKREPRPRIKTIKYIPVWKE